MLFCALAHSIYVLSADTLIEEALNAYQNGEEVGQIQYDNIVTNIPLYLVLSHNFALKLFFRTIKSP